MYWLIYIFAGRIYEEMEDIKQQVGGMIREARKAHGMTQEELGEKLGIGKTTINRYESGNHNITIDTLHKVLQAMDMKLVVKAE